MLISQQDFVPKLKAHLFPRVKAMLLKEFENSTELAHIPQNGLLPINPPDLTPNELDSLLFKHDRLYMHKIIRINYTTYDVRRAEDVINPGTTHRDILVLASSDTDTHPFCYARVIGIYHVNVIYTGPGMRDYRPRRMDFLWVRWFQYIDDTPAGWKAGQLDRLRFPPQASEDAFGFVDPANVLRGSHIVSMFSRGKVYRDGIGLSKCAQDDHDQHAYYVNRCVSMVLFGFYIHFTSLCQLC
jgi:hypothetical protein